MNTSIYFPIPEMLGAVATKPKHVLVFGMGETGIAIAKWCLKHGATVVVHDTRNEDKLSVQVMKALTQFGVERISSGADLSGINIEQFDLIAMSPGISPLHEPISGFLKNAESHQVPVWGELEFFAQALRVLKEHLGYSPKVLAITGTNGKTTTTALTGVIIAKAGKSVAIAGNISPAMLDKLSGVLEADELPQVWVLELSSYQLFYSQTFNPDAATVLNVSEDHLDWHGDMDHYLQSKAQIFGVDTIPVLNRDDLRVMSIFSEKDLDQKRHITFGMNTPQEPDSFGIVGDIAGGMEWLAWAMPVEEYEDGVKKKRRKSKLTEAQAQEPLQVKRLIPVEALLIKGRHNASNTLAALALGTSIDISMSSMLHGLRDYHGEPHRVQSVAIVNDVEYIDDSKGTNVGATLAALQGLGTTSPSIILIAGGDGKGQDFSPLQDPVKRFTKKVILLGRDAARIKEAIVNSGVAVIQVSTMEDAVKEASRDAKTGDKVLLSPACASLDMYKDYKHRAEVFVAAVEELQHSISGVTP